MASRLDRLQRRCLVFAAVCCLLFIFLFRHVDVDGALIEDGIVTDAITMLTQNYSSDGRDGDLRFHDKLKFALLLSRLGLQTFSNNIMIHSHDIK